MQMSIKHLEGEAEEDKPVDPSLRFGVEFSPLNMLGANLPGAFSPLGPGPGQAFGEMFSPLGCKRGFPREPGPWQAGRPPLHPCGPCVIQHKPSWEPQHGRGRDIRHRPRPWAPRRFRGPANFHGNEEDRRWALHNRPRPPPSDDREDDQGPEDRFKENWLLPGPWYCRPVPDSANFPWDEENRRWGSHNCPPPSLWDDRDHRGPEDCFEEYWCPTSLLPDPVHFAWPEFLKKEEHPRCPPGSLPGEHGGFQDGFPSWHSHGLGRKRKYLHHGHQKSTLGQHLLRPRSSRGNQPSSRSSPSRSATRWPGVKEEQQCPDPPQPLTSCKDGSQSSEQMAQGPPVESGKVPEPPGPAADPGAVTEAAEPEQAAGAMPVEPGAEQKPVGSHGQSPSASEMEPASPEESSAGTEEHPEVEPCSQSVPKAGPSGGSRPHTPTAPPEPAERVCAAAGSAGETLGGLWPSKNSQVLLGATMEPDAQPSQPSSDVCAPPETSPGIQDPPGSSETEAAGSQYQLCSTLLTSSPAGTDLRSAAVLARKEEIELSYQQFSLTIAVVATMLLQKEPSMEAALGLALRANLRQGRIHHLQELEDFINSYDSATLSR